MPGTLRTSALTGWPAGALKKPPLSPSTANPSESC
jgi:hypothetical protein